MAATEVLAPNSSKSIRYAGLVFLAALAFSALFAWVNYANYTWLSPLFERSLNPTTWGLLQRWYLIAITLAAALWKPKQVGFQIGTICRHWKMLLMMMAANVGTIAGYLLLTGATPYSGSDMLVNEVVIVPWVEEVFWRGIVFAAVAALLKKHFSDDLSAALAAVFSGVCFGLLHATNALFGYPLAFVLIQTLNATLWGLVYGFARARTGSIYPPIALHAAMNLMVVLI